MRSGRTVIITNDSSAKARSNFMARKALDSSARTHMSKRSRRGALSISSIASYFGVFLLITTLIAVSYQPVATERSSALANASPTTQTTTLAKVQSEAGSVDPVVAANIASSLADTTNMPVSNNVANLSQSLAVETMMTQTDSSTISKPQVVNMTADSRSTTTYVTQAGDTLDGVAEKYGLKKTTIAWANNLSSDALEPNVTLTILPTDGILYTTKDGDTLDAILAASCRKMNVQAMPHHRATLIRRAAACRQIATGALARQQVLPRRSGAWYLLAINMLGAIVHGTRMSAVFSSVCRSVVTGVTLARGHTMRALQD